MQTLFLTFYILKKYLSDYRLNKNENMYFVIYILAIIGMSKFELSLFDGAEYSRTWKEVFEIIRNFTSY